MKPTADNMLRRCFTLFLLGISCIAFCQEQASLNAYLSCYAPAADPNASYKSFILSIKPPENKNDEAFLHQLVKSVHHSFLKHYKAYAAFPDMFSSGDFDCLTGTTLFSLLLTHFQFNYSLIETNYHIFIIVHTKQGDLLLESTDLKKGLVSSPKLVASRVSQYRRSLPADPSKNVYRYHFNLYREIQPVQLAGLHYFNRAIAAFNKGDFGLCADLMKKSEKTYASPRMEELAALVLSAVSANGASKSEIEDVISRMQLNRSGTVAGL